MDGRAKPLIFLLSFIVAGVFMSGCIMEERQDRNH